MNDYTKMLFMKDMGLYLCRIVLCCKPTKKHTIHAICTICDISDKHAGTLNKHPRPNFWVPIPKICRICFTSEHRVCHNVDMLTATEARRKLLERELERLVRYLRGENPPPERVILFGSFAQGKIEKWSDLDVVVIQRTESPFWARTRRLYEQLQPRVGMDILIYTPKEFEHLKSTRRFFQEEILAKGRIIYERDEHLA